MRSVEELSVTAVRSAMASGFDQERVAFELVERSRRNVTALRMARARVERGAGWRSGPIGQRARDALTMAIDLCDGTTPDLDAPGPHEVGLTGLTRPIDLRADPISLDIDLAVEVVADLDDTLPA